MAVAKGADKECTSHVEDIEEGQMGDKKEAVTGTVRLTEGSIVYIPTPTADPQDPLNMPYWQKLVVVVVISIFSTLGLALVSGFGGLLGFYIPEYGAAGKGYADITHLMTYPTLFMGIGNLIGMPLAIGVGRRIVLLGSTVILVIGAILCATAKTFEWHLASRMVVGLAAGQSEALVPMITQEIFFLHERSKALMGQLAIQVTLTSIWVLCASPIAEAITPQWWYGLGSALSGVLLVLAFCFLPETKYDRSASSYQGGSTSDDVKADSSATEGCTERPELDFVTFAPRTWKSDLRLWIGTPDWSQVAEVFRQTFELLFFPNVLWALLLNGLTIGVNVAIGTTYSTVLSAGPYNWPDSSASYVNCGQIIVALLALPLLGHGSDWLIKYFARRNEGLHEPEIRIIPLIFPITVGVFTAVLYGQGAASPYHYHWFVYVWTVAAYYFCFVGANIVAITYLLDSYPTRAGPLLVIICAFRGIISFGTSYGVAPFIERYGYDGTFVTFAGLTGGLGLLGIPIFIWGKRIRQFTGQFIKTG
ncbi:putative MFS transporter [Aspergillus homomorphus CBS 101889]|uniref:Putative MFS transporter n=1 Tax=Aspergillus homomorphus (strain CBS 101889) TaxID=1450537 RepID=A0A395HI23_ASPHC|nr:putative MFS transporter [Aspergillus homomorphus CBS 101889]RAL07139.1 putative MFS transporter [Aspergillus homomorphus CBS 101889]